MKKKKKKKKKKKLSGNEIFYTYEPFVIYQVHIGAYKTVCLAVSFNLKHFLNILKTNSLLIFKLFAINVLNYYAFQNNKIERTRLQIIPK